MGDALKKVKSGDVLTIPAGTFNAFIGGAAPLNLSRENGGGPPGGSAQADAAAAA